jgi:hypothetical protein
VFLSAWISKSLIEEVIDGGGEFQIFQEIFTKNGQIGEEIIAHQLIVQGFSIAAVL